MKKTLPNKTEIIKKFRLHENDTGSSSVQIALLTERIKKISEHLKKFKKDHHSRLGLIKLINQRRKHLKYLYKANSELYYRIIKELDIRGI